MAAASSTIAPRELPHELDVRSDIKPRTAEGALFDVGTFRSEHGERVRYREEPGDEVLLQGDPLHVTPPLQVASSLVLRVWPGSADGSSGVESSVPAVEAAVAHPLLSVRRAVGESAPKKRTELAHRNFVQTHRGVSPTRAPIDDLGDLSSFNLIPTDSVLLRVAIGDVGEWRREFILHGEQTLLDLRGLISCITSEQLAWQQKQLVTDPEAQLEPQYQLSDSACLCI